MTVGNGNHDSNQHFRLIHSALSAYDRSGSESDFNGL